MRKVRTEILKRSCGWIEAGGGCVKVRICVGLRSMTCSLTIVSLPWMPSTSHVVVVLVVTVVESSSAVPTSR